MIDYDTETCDACGDSFTVHPSARAAETAYCSPRCHTRGEHLDG